MKVYCKGQAQVQDVHTGKIYAISFNELEWTQSGDVRKMGVEHTYNATLQHPYLGELSWDITEYPAGVENSKVTSVGEHLLVEDFEYGLEHQDPNDEPSENSIFSESYFDEDDPEQLFQILETTKDEQETLDVDDTAEKLANWFLYYHEDPAQSTPYISAEGGYLYVHGGPYDANEVLSGEFSHLVPEKVIKKGLEIIEREGMLEWAPSENHWNRRISEDDILEEQSESATDSLENDFQLIERHLGVGKPILLNSKKELNVRREVLNSISELKEQLPDPQTHGGIGHNNPPDQIELSNPELEELKERIDSVEKQLNSKEPDVAVVHEDTGYIKKIISLVSKKLGITTDAFCKGFGKSLGLASGAAVVTVFVPEYMDKLGSLLVNLKDWLFIAIGL